MTHKFKIGNKIIGSNGTFLIAEAGVNHNGSLEIAKKLIGVAVEANANAVKFQTFNAADLILPDIEKAPYQKNTTKASESQTQMLEKLQIDESFHRELIGYCEQKNIIFLSTPYEKKSLDLLLKLDVSAIKIASTDTTNLLFLEEAAKSGKPVILSTGMCFLSEIEQAYNCLRQNGGKYLAILKCTSNYPTDPSEVNLRAMQTLALVFDAVIGFSDHTEGVGASPYAVALGAKIVEKHFTLDKTMEGPDHQASLSPDELKNWVKEIRKVEMMLGSQEVTPTKSEAFTKKSLQKCLVSRIDIEKGEFLSRGNIIAKRIGDKGISAVDAYGVLGLKANQKIKKNQPIHWWFLES